MGIVATERRSFQYLTLYIAYLDWDKEAFTLGARGLASNPQILSEVSVANG